MPTVRRTATRLGLSDQRTCGGHRRFSATDAKRLAEQVGTTPAVTGFTPADVKVLAAFARQPIGFRSLRAVARSAHVSPSTASAAVESLAARELVGVSTETVAEGSARDLVMRRLRPGPEWSRIASVVSQTVPPLTDRTAIDTETAKVPQRFWHHFWNVDPGKLQLPDDEEFVARRLLLSQDPIAWAWAAQHLSPTAIRSARRARGVDGPTGAMIDNLVRWT